jgi:hypothetical protein
MNVKCNSCGKDYDDAECWTICPHHLFMARADLDRKKLALSLLGKWLVFNHRPAGVPPAQITSIGWNGMISLAGMSGEFSPDLFTITEAPEPHGG